EPLEYSSCAASFAVVDGTELIMRLRISTVVWLAGIGVAGALLCLQCAGAEDQASFGIDRRIPWTTSRVVGSPEPPLPYTVEKIFTNIAWKAPVFIAPEAETDYLLVVQAGGEQDRPSKVLRVQDDPAADHTETFLELSNRFIYS